jgi:hypothetical protein
MSSIVSKKGKINMKSMDQKYRWIVSTVMNGILLLGLLASCPDYAVGEEFRWPTEFTGSGLDLENGLGRPDGYITEIGPWVSVTYSTFADAQTFDPAALAELLGVSIEIVNASDFLAFEVWGTFFEYSTWTFSSGEFTHVVHAPGDALATGMITTAAYINFFDIDVQGGDEIDDMWQFILLDLGPVSGFADDIEVQIVGVNGAYGTPDLDAFGIMSNGEVSSEKSTWSRVKGLYR